MGAAAGRPGLRLLARIAGAAALLALAVALVGRERLAEQLARIDLAWFGAALASTLVAQLASVLRWRSIAIILGLHAPAPPLFLAYFQGVAVNALLPGATLGGDALRSLRLQRLGNPLSVAALSVLIDRASGLWVLCLLSLATGVAVLLRAPPGLEELLGGHGALVLWSYLLGLAAACGLPFLPFRLPAGGPEAAHGVRRLLARLGELHALALERRRPLAWSLWGSLVVQALSALTLWLCVRAAGGDAGYWQVQAAAAPVFIAGVMPLSYGGFGARELTALLVFPLVGVAAGVGVAAAALYGLAAVVLGLAAAPLIAVRPGGAPG